MSDKNGKHDKPSSDTGTNLGLRRMSARKESGEVYEERRKELLDAAATVFRAKGYHGAKLKDVALELDRNPATIYYYYASKQELFQAVVERVVTANVADAVNVRRGELPPAEKLRAILKLLMRSYDANYPHMFVFLQEDPARLEGTTPEWTARMTKWSRDYYRSIREIISDGLGDGTLVSDKPAWFLAHSVIGMVNWTYRWYQPDGDLSADEAGDGFADLILNGLAAPKPRQK